MCLWLLVKTQIVEWDFKVILRMRMKYHAQNHLTILLHYLRLYPEPQKHKWVSYVLKRDTKNVTKWAPNWWNYPFTLVRVNYYSKQTSWHIIRIWLMSCAELGQNPVCRHVNVTSRWLSARQLDIVQHDHSQLEKLDDIFQLPITFYASEVLLKGLHCIWWNNNLLTAFYIIMFNYYA